MKAYETTLFAATLLIVPALAWLVGGVMGRRDMRIGSVIIAGGLMALVPHLGRLALLTLFDARPFADAFLYQLSRTRENPEVGLFFAALGVFMTMLGWTATPVLASKS